MPSRDNFRRRPSGAHRQDVDAAAGKHVLQDEGLFERVEVFRLKMAGKAARFTVPSAFMASLPTLRVSGTCLARTTIFNVFSLLSLFI